MSIQKSPQNVEKKKQPKAEKKKNKLLAKDRRRAARIATRRLQGPNASERDWVPAPTS